MIRQIFLKVGRSNLLVLALLLAPSLLLVDLQADTTNAGSRLAPEAAWTVLPDYYNGQLGQSWHDNVPQVIFRARILVRGLLHAGMWLTFHQFSFEKINTVIQLAFIWPALFIVYRIGRSLALSTEWALIAALLAAVFIPWGFLTVGSSTSFSYDLPAVFFAAAGLWAILNRRFAWLVAVIAVGTINKETTLFLIPAYFFAEWRSSPQETRRIFVQTAILFIFFALSYETPRLLLQSGHPHLITASATIPIHPRWYFNLRMFLIFSPAENFYWVALLHLAPILRFQLLPLRLQAIYLATVFFLVPLLFFGNFNELRLFSDLIPLGAAGTAFVLTSLLAEIPRPVPTSS